MGDVLGLGALEPSSRPMQGGCASLGVALGSPLVRMVGPHGPPRSASHLQGGQVNEGVALVGLPPEIHW
jgi:hypothetical protein